MTSSSKYSTLLTTMISDITETSPLNSLQFCSTASVANFQGNLYLGLVEWREGSTESRIIVHRLDSQTQAWTQVYSAVLFDDKDAMASYGCTHVHQSATEDQLAAPLSSEEIYIEITAVDRGDRDHPAGRA